jgi:hypothetical protein
MGKTKCEGDPERVRSELAALSEPLWGYRDVMTFFGCGASKAEAIVGRAREHGGSAPYMKTKVLADAVLSTELGPGSTRGSEIAVRQSLLISLEAAEGSKA